MAYISTEKPVKSLVTLLNFSFIVRWLWSAFSERKEIRKERGGRGDTRRFLKLPRLKLQAAKTPFT